MDVSTNVYERRARTRKVEKLVDAAVALADLRDLPLADVADFWGDASDEHWEALELLAGTRPQQTQDYPCGIRTRQRVVNGIKQAERRRTRALKERW